MSTPSCPPATALGNAHLEPLLNPRSIAIIGASPDKARIGGMALELLVRYGFRGGIYPVNPKYEQVFGLRCWPSVEELQETPDLAVLVTSAPQVTPLLRRCHARGIRAAVVYASGFSEAGDEGRALQDELTAFVQTSGMALAGPNCMGLANFKTDAYTAFSTVLRDIPRQAGSGWASILAQSGNLCSAIYILGRSRGVGFNHFINTGNEAGVAYPAYLDYLAADPDTSIVLSYLEQLRDGAAFIAATACMGAAGKMLAVLKSGSSEQGRLAVQSHTAALAGDDAVYRAAFAQLNVVQVTEFAHLADLATLATARTRQAGPRVLILSVSGAMGAVMADRLVEAGCSVPALPAPLRAALGHALPGFAMSFNPIDLTGNIVSDPSKFETLLELCATTDAVDTVVLYSMGVMLDAMVPALLAVTQRHARLVCVFDGGRAARTDELRQAGIPVFQDIGQGLAALAHTLRWTAQAPRTQRWLALRLSAATGVSTAPAAVHEQAVRAWLGAWGLPSPREALATHPEEAAALACELGFPVAIKVVSDDIAHKSDIGGVVLNLTQAADVAAACTELLRMVAQHAPQARVRGVLVQAMERGVAELILGVTRDPVFGPVLTVGLGGTLTELYRDVSHRLAPVDEEMALDMLQALKAYPLLTGFRGCAPGDVKAACAAIARFSQMAAHLPATLASVEINPLLVKPDGQGVVMLDALAVPAT